MMHEIPELDAKGLREFGFTTAGIVMGLFGLALPWLLDFSYPLWPWILGGVLATWSLLHAASLNPVYKIWMKLGMVMGWVMSKVVLSIVFYLLIAPLGVIMRLVGKDSMTRTLDKNIESYRVLSNKRDRKHMERPF